MIKALKGNTSPVNGVAFSPDGRVFATASSDQTVKLWDVKSGRLLRILKGHGSVVQAVAFSPDGQTLASGGGDLTVRLWNVGSGKSIRVFTGHLSSVNAVAFSPNGQVVASASADQTIKLWDVNGAGPLLTLNGHHSSVESIAFSPNGKVMASGSGDKTVILWDAEKGKKIEQLQGHGSFVQGVAFSPNGAILASCSHDQTVKLWNSRNGSLLRTLNDHSSYVEGLAISPNGKLLASCGRDKTVVLYDVESGALLDRFEGHHSSVEALAFSPNSQALVSGGLDATIKLWDLGSGKVIRTCMALDKTDWVSWAPNLRLQGSTKAMDLLRSMGLSKTIGDGGSFGGESGASLVSTGQTPQITLAHPRVEQGGQYQHKGKSIVLTGHANAKAGISEVSINGRQAEITSNSRGVGFSLELVLAVGKELPVKIEAISPDGQKAEFTFSLSREASQDTTPPQIVFEDVPPDKGFYHQSSFLLKGEVVDASSLELVLVQDKPVSLDTAGRFEERIHLHPGYNRVVVYARDGSGNYNEAVLHFNRPGEKRVALVIGNGNYVKVGFLANSINDARDMKKSLEQAGFQVIYGEDLDLQGFIEKSRELKSALMEPGSVGLFFYAGHGLQVDQKNFLVPADGDIAMPSEVRTRCFSIDEVIGAMTDSNSRLNIVILDACRDNPFEGAFRSGTRGFAPVQANSDTLIVFATALGKKASDGPGLSNGLFCTHLLRHLSTPGLDIIDVFRRTSQGVKADSGGQQEPWLNMSPIEPFYLFPPE